MKRLADAAPELARYYDRAEVAVRVAGGAKGAVFRGRQCLQDKYAATPHKGTIPPIDDRVRERLGEIEEEGGD